MPGYIAPAPSWTPPVSEPEAGNEIGDVLSNELFSGNYNPNRSAGGVMTRILY